MSEQHYATMITFALLTRHQPTDLELRHMSMWADDTVAANLGQNPWNLARIVAARHTRPMAGGLVDPDRYPSGTIT